MNTAGPTTATPAAEVTHPKERLRGALPQTAPLIAAPSRPPVQRTNSKAGRKSSSPSPGWQTPIANRFVAHPAPHNFGFPTSKLEDGNGGPADLEMCAPPTKGDLTRIQQISCLAPDVPTAGC